MSGKGARNREYNPLAFRRVALANYRAFGNDNPYPLSNINTYPRDY